METVDKGVTVSLQELVVYSLAQTDALSKLLIEKDCGRRRYPRFIPRQSIVLPGAC